MGLNGSNTVGISSSSGDIISGILDAGNLHALRIPETLGTSMLSAIEINPRLAATLLKDGSDFFPNKAHFFLRLPRLRAGANNFSTFGK